MKKRVFSSVLLLSLICSISYAQSGNYTDTRSVGSFNAIKVCCGIDLYISEGNSSSITIETNYEEHLPKIKTEVKRGELKISIGTGNLMKRPNDMRVKVSVSAQNLTAIKASSGSDVFSATPLTANDIEVSASSGSGIKLELHATKLKCSTSSGSDIKLTGSAGYASVSASSGSDIKMNDMTVRVAEVSASMGSDITVNVTDEIKAKASMGADVKFKGNPKTVNKKESMGGDVRQVN